MATKSPGVYMNTIDNTEYTNATTVSGTNVAVVGYATKGPIGVPTVINSYSNFKKTFGSPTSVGYSSMAVKNVLSAGGGILFERVADSTASSSSYIVKNGNEQIYGYASFNKSTDILVGSLGYSNGKIYAMKYTDDSSTTTVSKIFYVRSPSSGKLTQASILSQLSKQIEYTHGTDEYLVTDTSSEGCYSFNYTVNGTTAFDVSHPLFVKLTNKETGAVMAESILKAINAGSDPVCKVGIAKEVNSAYEAVSAKDILPTSMKNLTFGFKIYTDSISEGLTIKVNVVENETYQQLADDINTLLYKDHGIKVILYEDPAVTTKDKTALLLIDVNGGKNLSITSLKTSTCDSVPYSYPAEESDLFATTDSAIYSEGKISSSNTNFKGISVVSNSNIASVSAGVKCGVEYNEDTNSIIFTADPDVDYTTNAPANGSVISVNEFTYGNYLFGDTASSAKHIGLFNGQSSISKFVTISRDTDSKKIKFTSTSSNTSPTLENITVDEKATETYKNTVKDLLTIVNGVTKTTGKDKVDDTRKDMVIISSNEKGSGTDNISVEMYTSTSPIDETKKHNIYVYVDSSLKETFENVSLVYADTAKRFDTVINQKEDNGGSKYINIEVIKNDVEEEVEFPDGTYKIGMANKDDDIAKTSSVDSSAYGLYDYVLGNDGIPEDGDSLFTDALSTDSELANTELYDYQILITPDDINQDVQDAAIALCESTDPATYIADPPVGYSKENVIKWHNGKLVRTTAITSKFAEVYSPWCKVYDSTSSSYVWVMPSVFMAAKFVAVDKAYGSWYAPAGETNGILSFVLDVENKYKREDRDALYVDYNRINPIIEYSNGNIMVYGEKTCQRKHTVLTKIHTVRMVIELKRKLQASLRGFIFQPNIQGSLSKIQSTISAIMEKYKSGGGLDSYTVVCDSSNNTTETMQHDIVNVDVAFVPNGFIEQIEINLSLNKSSSTVTVS